MISLREYSMMRLHKRLIEKEQDRCTITLRMLKLYMNRKSKVENQFMKMSSIIVECSSSIRDKN